MSNSEQDAVAKYKQHPIQLVAVEVLELFIKREPGADEPEQALSNADFSLSHGHTNYSPENHKIAVKLSAEIGLEDQENSLPFSLKVELLAIFDVDEDNFPVDKITHWASHNAPLVVYPYLREQVYGLTSKAGFKGVILPLFEIPTFKVLKQ